MCDAANCPLVQLTSTYMMKHSSWMQCLQLVTATQRNLDQPGSVCCGRVDTKVTPFSLQHQRRCVEAQGIEHQQVVHVTPRPARQQPVLTMAQPAADSLPSLTPGTRSFCKASARGLKHLSTCTRRAALAKKHHLGRASCVCPSDQSQVGSVILNLPNSMAKCGMALGIVFQVTCASAAVYTLWLLSALYQEFKRSAVSLRGVGVVLVG